LGEEGIELIKSMKCEQMKIIGDRTSFCTKIGAKTSFIPSFASLFSTFIAAAPSSHDLSSLKLLHTNFFHTSFLQGVFCLSFFSISAWKEISNVEKYRHGVLFAIRRCALFFFLLFFDILVCKQGVNLKHGHGM
jgi:hypothetical protein